MAYTTDKHGNYVRTVRCGHCYEIGHNRSSCELKKQDHKDKIERYSREIADGEYDGDEWALRRAQKHIDRHKAILETTYARGKNRKCSHCSEPGHTKRTCSFRKQKLASWKAALSRQQERYIQSFEEAGFGVGSLVDVRHGDEDRLALVTAVNLNKLRPLHDIKPDDTNYHGGTALVEVRLCAPYTASSWGQHVVVQSFPASLPLEVHNFMCATLTISEYRRAANGFCAAIVGRLDNPSFTRATEKEIEERAAAMTDDGHSPEDKCNYGGK
jgi:hypothetical protein